DEPADRPAGRPGGAGGRRARRDVSRRTDDHRAEAASPPPGEGEGGEAMTTRCQWFAAAGLLLLAAGCVPKGTTAPANPAELPTVTVTIASVQVRSLPRSVAAVGTLNGYEEVTLA